MCTLVRVSIAVMDLQSVNLQVMLLTHMEIYLMKQNLQLLLKRKKLILLKLTLQK